MAARMRHSPGWSPNRRLARKPGRLPFHKSWSATHRRTLRCRRSSQERKPPACGLSLAIPKPQHFLCDGDRQGLAAAA